MKFSKRRANLRRTHLLSVLFSCCLLACWCPAPRDSGTCIMFSFPCLAARSWQLWSL